MNAIAPVETGSARRRLLPHSVYVLKLNGRSAYAEEDICFRQTPPGEPKVPDLIKEGDTVRTSYGTGPYVVRRITRTDFEGHEAYSLSLAEPSRPNVARVAVNDLVAVGGRVLALMECNDDEVLLSRRPKGLAPIQMSLF